jgi:hypothetical protein
MTVMLAGCWGGTLEPPDAAVATGDGDVEDTTTIVCQAPLGTTPVDCSECPPVTTVTNSVVNMVVMYVFAPSIGNPPTIREGEVVRFMPTFETDGKWHGFKSFPDHIFNVDETTGPQCFRFAYRSEGYGFWCDDHFNNMTLFVVQ